MIQVKIFIIVVLAVSMKTVLATLSADEMKRDEEMEKMFFCSGCKDASVQKKLEEGLYKCLTTSFAEFVPKGHKIHEENGKNVEGCWTQMSKLIKEMTASEENVKKFHDCLTKVPKDDIKKCQ